jgi:SAM-dependent methyltransferase
MTTSAASMGCVICGSDCSTRLELYDDRYGYPGRFSLQQCGGCKHAFLDGEFSFESLRDLYSRYYPRSTFDLDAYQPYQERTGFGAWLDGERSAPFRWVPRNVRVLDIGCGFGETLGYYLARGCEAYGVEVDENIRPVAARFGYDVHVGLFDPTLYKPASFDFVTMGQVIEHVTDPMQTLHGVARVLKPGGRAILSTPNARGWGARVFRRRWINWHQPYHRQFFTVRSMRLAAAQAGLVVESVTTITPSDWLHYQWIHLLTRPVEGQPSGFWAPTGKLSASRKAAVHALWMLHRLRLNHMITRAFDMLRLGDNYLCVLRKP